MGQPMKTTRAKVMFTAMAAIMEVVRVALLSSVLASFFAGPNFLTAQGVLTVTPGVTVAAAAGTGAVGYAGDGAAATAASLANPRAVAYDASGNLYLADAANHVVRKISNTGVITTIAGTGIQGYGGDGGAATAGFLDTPTGVAVDSRGDIYIADSHNHRIRKLSGGTITTIAGVGTPGFSGDGAAAIGAQLWLPTGVAVDSSDNVYIADTNNQRIREISGGVIRTIAGDGEEYFAGDGGGASLAALDTPTGVAVDGMGDIYIADRHNQRIRVVGSNGGIITAAGSGSASFSGSFSGDGGTATEATLAKPSGVGADGFGGIYIADTGNQRIREVSGGTIATALGSGQQGFGGDGSTPGSVNLSSPRAVAPDPLGDLAVADKLNQRVRVVTLPTLTFASDGFGNLSPPQSVILSNTGTAPISVSTITVAGGFAIARGGSCPSPPISLDVGASCSENIAFLPTAVGIANGAVVFGGAGIAPQRLLLTGAGAHSGDVVALTSSAAFSFLGQPITFAALVNAIGVGTPTGTATFYDGATQIGSGQTLAGGTASVTTTGLLPGLHTIKAVYSGDANFAPGSPAALVQTVVDFGITLATGSSGGGGGGGSQTVVPGGAVTYGFNLLPIGAAFAVPVTLSASGLPPGATVTFTPQVLILGNSPSSFTMTIQTAASTGLLLRKGLYGSGVGGTLALGLLLLPFSGRTRWKPARWRVLCVALISSFLLLGALTGCGSRSGFFGQSPQSFTVQVIGTATGGIVLQHFATVTLVVE
jgi:hypothetical protein